jgi:hypothetical protein
VVVQRGVSSPEESEVKVTKVVFTGEVGELAVRHLFSELLILAVVVPPATLLDSIQPYSYIA